MSNIGMVGAMLPAAALVAGAGRLAWTPEIKVTVERNEHPTAEFKFERVPRPVKGDLAARPGAKFTIVEGKRDANGDELSALNDGALPKKEDEPRANFFFEQGADGGRIVLDLGEAVQVAQVNTYSWHPDTRGPQVYGLYVSDGMDKAFNAAPGRDVKPKSCGWVYLTDVDTRPKQGEMGGQYGVSVSAEGGLGKYRYLLFDITETEDDDKYGNTFYSEIDVIGSEDKK